ncbi:NAD(P)-dependent alcohol dehydrogenase [Mangrovibacterium lignilyticum]|uniref:NAD(P)-dependent alcohol dehydrogenase n=1 Tax=Mangrovibacterium lignilyticum TaxID=2668052 RepID=UPI001967BF02|nr:NAD(P)-dependent alcohol dehydrogenase [Mangrovibacterium lignilyticum]
MMKAIVYNKKALPYRLVYSDVDQPIPNDDELLIQVQAVSLNAADYRSLKLGIIPQKKIFGADIVGIVESVGKNIHAYKPGDQLIGNLAEYGFGGLAEYALAPERLVTAKPVNCSVAEAATLPMAGQTALQALRNKGEIKPGDDVLIIGSGGGVGSYAVQLAKFFGARVTAVCSPKNVEQARWLGADDVVDYTTDNFLTDKRSYDLIVAINGNYSLLACKRILRPGGRYVMVGGALTQVFKAILFGRLLSFGTKKIRSLAEKTTVTDLEFIAQLANDKKIKPVVETCYPLEQAPEAMHYLAEGHCKGKIVITID